jgi:hypothetical protein
MSFKLIKFAIEWNPIQVFCMSVTLISFFMSNFIWTRIIVSKMCWVRKILYHNQLQFIKQKKILFFRL